MKRVFSNSLVVSLLLFLSKILGFIRDSLLARFFGSSVFLQVFLIAFRFPEFIRKVTSSGAITQIVNPYLQGKVSEKHKYFIATVLCFLALLLLIATLLVIIFNNTLVDIYAYGLVKKQDLLRLVKSLFVIMIPYVLFSCVIGLISAILNSYSKYLMSSIIPIILNVVMVLGIVVSPYFGIPIYAVAYSVLIAGLLQLIVGLYSLASVVGKIRITRDIVLLKDTKAKFFLRKLPTAFFGAAILQINALIETFFASFLLSGSLAWLYYADRVNQFLYGIFGTAIATVIIPHLIDCKKDKEQFHKNIAWTMKFALFVVIPAIVGLFILAKPIVITLFYYGKFSLNDVDSTYLAMLGYLLSLFCFVLVRVIISALYVQNKARVVFYISLVCLLLNVGLDIYIIHFYSADKYAFLYLALSGSVVAFINLSSQLLVLSEFRLSLFFHMYIPIGFIIRVVIACCFMAIVLNMFDLSNNYWSELKLFGRLNTICLVIFTGAIVYLGTAFLMGIIKSLKIKEL